MPQMNRSTALILNAAHALDHLVLLIFASAVTAIALEFGIARWEDLMPYTAGAFVMFGVGSIPAGRLGDLWGRRKMMLVFFYGTAACCFAVAMTQNPIQIEW
jgi:MFS family permease